VRKYDASPTVAAGLIRLARYKAGLTQSELGERAGIDQQVVSAYETGRREPTLPTLTKLLAAAGFEMRIRLEPTEDHDQTLADYLATLPPDGTADVDMSSRTRTEGARLRRVRGG
jgi:transcriptional regulator with XRE-family HTH domain